MVTINRPTGRFFIALFAILLPLAARAGDRGASTALGLRHASLGMTGGKTLTHIHPFVGTLPLTQISDTVYRADGNPANGTVLIAWPAFTTASGQVVAAGTLSVQLASNGFFTAGLAATTGSTPTGVYYSVVYQLNDGSNKQEYWAVPATDTTTIAAVRSKLVPANVAAQFMTRDLADSSYIHVDGTQTVNGVKTFSQPPTVPTPAADTDAVNKAYVDANSGTNLASPPPIGSKVPNAVNATLLLAQSANGELNPLTLPGSDLAAQIASAKASNLCPGNACKLKIPAGSYTFQNTIDATGMAVECSNKKGTTLTFTGSSGTAVYLGPQKQYASFKGCTLKASGTNTAVGVQCDRTSYCDIDSDIEGFDTGIWATGPADGSTAGGNTRLTGTVRNYTSAGLKIDHMIDTYISVLDAYAPANNRTAYCAIIDTGASGVNIDRLSCGTSSILIRDSMPTANVYGIAPNYVLGDIVVADTCPYDCLIFDASLNTPSGPGGYARGNIYRFVNSWFSGATQPNTNGVGIYGGYDIKITKSTMRRNSRHGVYLAGGANVALEDNSVKANHIQKAYWVPNLAYSTPATITPTVNNSGNYLFSITQIGTAGATQPNWCQAQGCSQPDGSIMWTNSGIVAPDDGDGYHVAAGVSDFQIIGGLSSANTDFDSGQQHYGVRVEAGASDDFTIAHLQATNNVNGPISDSSTGTHKLIFDVRDKNTSDITFRNRIAFGDANFYFDPNNGSPLINWGPNSYQYFSRTAQQLTYVFNSKAALSISPTGISQATTESASLGAVTAQTVSAGGATVSGDLVVRDIPGHEYFVSGYGSIQAALDAAYNNGSVLGGAMVIDDRTAPYTGAGWIVRDSVTLKLAATTYTINGTVQYNNGVKTVTAGIISLPGSHIVGAGTSANHGTNINAANGLNADLIATGTVGTGTGSNAQWWHWGSLENFHMDGNKSQQTAGNCINVENMGETAVLRAIEAGNCYGDDLRLEGNFATQSEISNITVNSAGQYGVNLDNFQGVGVLRGLSGDSNATSIIRFNGNQSGTLTVLGLKSEEEISGHDPLITIDMPGDGSEPAFYLVGGYTYGRTGLKDVIKIVNGKLGAAPFVQVSNFYVDANFTNAVNDTVNSRTVLSANMNKVPFSYLPTGAYMSGQAFTFAPGTFIQGGSSALTEIFGSNTDSSTMIAAQGNGDGTSYFTGGLKIGIPNRVLYGSTPEMMARMGSRFLGVGQGYDTNTWVFVPIWKTGDASNRWIGEPNQRWPELYAADVNTTTATVGTLNVTNCNGCNPVGGVHLLNYQVNTSTLIGNGTDQAIYSYTVPAATMLGGTGVHCWLKAQRVSGSGSITYKWKFGAATMSYAAVTSSSQAISTEMEIFDNPGSTTAQIVNLGELHAGNSILAGAVLNTAAAENSSNAIALSVTFNGASTEQLKGVTFKCIEEQ